MFSEHHEVVLLKDKTLVLGCHGVSVEHIVEKAPMESFRRFTQCLEAVVA